MAVILYHKDGKQIKVEPEVFRSYLSSGDWFLSQAKAQRSVEHDLSVANFKSDLEIEPSEMTDDEVRADAKEKGIDHWHLKNIGKLRKEVEEWQLEA